MPSIETIRKRLETFVKVRSVDSTLTHLEQILLFKNQDKICGSFSHNEIKIWLCSNRVIGAFYPVVHLSTNEINDKIVIRSKINRVGLVLAILINVAIVWASLSMFILREDVTSASVVQRFIVFIVFIGIFNFPVYMSYKGARDVLILEIVDRIQMKQPLTQDW
jgi:hypothetical protein